MKDLEKLFASLSATGGSVDEVRLVVSSYSPLRWQATARFRDRTKAWGVSVSEDPLEAFVNAVGQVTGKKGAKRSVRFHERKPEASEHLATLLDIYGDAIAASKIEFEPYKGFVIVVWPEDGMEDRLDRIKNEIEIRNDIGGRKEAAAPSSPPPSDPPSVEGGKIPSRQEMEDRWKLGNGKYPPRNWKKPELWKNLREAGL